MAPSEQPRKRSMSPVWTSTFPTLHHPPPQRLRNVSLGGDVDIFLNPLPIPQKNISGKSNPRFSDFAGVWWEICHFYPPSEQAEHFQLPHFIHYHDVVPHFNGYRYRNTVLYSTENGLKKRKKKKTSPKTKQSIKTHAERLQMVMM